MKKYVVPAALSILVALATVALAVDKADDPGPGEEPVVSSAIATAAIVVLAVGALSTSTRSLRHDLRQESDLRLRRKLERRLSAVLITLYRDRPLHTEWYRVGLNVWLLPRLYRALTPEYRWRRRLPAKLRDWLRSSRMPVELKRRAKVRLEEAERPTGISWRRGKGVVGECWDTHEPVFFNSEQDYGPYMNATADEWAAAPEAVKKGLTFEEFERVRNRYGDVVAVPMFLSRGEDDEHPEFVGCIAFDTPRGSHETEDTLTNHVIPMLVAGAARITEALSPTS